MSGLPEGWATLTLEIPRQLKMELKLEAWKENIPLTQYLRELLAQRGKWQRCGYDKDPP